MGNYRLNCFSTDTYKDTYVGKGNPGINRGSPMASHNETCTIVQLSTFTKYYFSDPLKCKYYNS